AEWGQSDRRGEAGDQVVTRLLQPWSLRHWSRPVRPLASPASTAPPVMTIAVPGHAAGDS
ncbi:MAG: hypothetical protein ACKOJF_11055, partial [Planctomycetaceae bacterium]